MKIPGPYMKMKAEHPALMRAYEAFGDECAKAGPLDARTVALVKLGISLAAGLEGASHSHTRKALEAGCAPEQLLHVAHLCAPTIGFPGMMRGRGWVAETIKEQGA